ncbi:hypothetical protein BU17DRAFT_61173 [Hysterangium stoloniferum]|nr:hypothetical protein BU17DRAFT_61173 [Hysterangium stoloniferum]
MAEVEPIPSAQPAVDAPTEIEGDDAAVTTPQFDPQQPSGQPFRPPTFSFYGYPPEHPPNQDPNVPPATGEQIIYPPTIYPYIQVPSGYMPVSMAGMPIPGVLLKPRRKQVKIACTNCATACKRCDETRPCERCIKYGMSESCRDGIRKERERGVLRGRYNKKKRQEEREPEAVQSNSNNEWTPPTDALSFPGGPAPPGSFPPPEGYYPAFYPIPPSHGPGTQSGQEDDNTSPDASTAETPHAPDEPLSFPPPPHAQYAYPPLPPGSYPPFGFPYPVPPNQHPLPQQQSEHEDPVETTREKLDDGPKEVDEGEEVASVPRKKQGSRPSDAKRRGKKPGGSKRKSTRHAQQVPGGHIDTHVNEMITDQDIVGRSEDPVI